MGKTTRPTRMPYPPHDEYRGGCKVSWLYYRDKAKAEEAAKAAAHNREIDLMAGYDFGYCWPGDVYGPDEQRFHPGMYEVCIP